jgi:flavin reductase (DIM6/NTAB) family NADH-FMN oxidoreductase RutF
VGAAAFRYVDGRSSYDRSPWFVSSNMPFKKMNFQSPNLEQVDSLLKLVDREIWLVTAAAGGKRSALTATWVSQVSLDRERPVLLAGLSPRNFTTELVQESGLFTAHLVQHELVPLAFRLASTSGRDGDKLADVPVLAHESGALILTEARAWFACRVFHHLDTGDRRFFWGDVIAAEEAGRGSPLKEQAFFQALSLEQRQQLKALREADAAALRPLVALWSSRSA